MNLRAPGVDFGFPFLFPIPGTNMAAQHEPSMPEVPLVGKNGYGVENRTDSGAEMCGGLWVWGLCFK